MHIQVYLPGDFLPFIVAFVIIFATGLLIMSIISRWMCKIVKDSPLDGLDRLLGCLFGLTKGVIMIVFVAFILDFTGFQEIGGLNRRQKQAIICSKAIKK